MTRNIIVMVLAAALMGVFVLAVRGQLPFTRPVVPAIRGYSEGQEILFLHTEASDVEIAQTLTGMTGSPVLVIPSLAQAPEEMLAGVYVFTNGVTGGGPLGFQPDVFDNPPAHRGIARYVWCTWSPGKMSHPVAN